ncbi:MAG: hypothetical protein KDD15_23020, partial [Lewinella sp.]|nr:hypothetical protein [Lewinella sp.]
ITLLGLAKLFHVDDRLESWWNDYERSFREPAPEPIEQGTVCHLLTHLDEQESILLLDPEAAVEARMDTMVQSWNLDSIEVMIQRARTAHGAVAQIDINELVYFEALTQDRARLIFYDGSSEVHDLGAVLQLIRDRDKCHFFQAVSFEGQAYEYFNILYTEAFEKVNCDAGTYYLARLNVTAGGDPAARAIVNCGTDLFSHYIYQKTRRRLESLNPSSDFSYRRELEWHDCVCSEGRVDSVAVTQ